MPKPMMCLSKQKWLQANQLIWSVGSTTSRASPTLNANSKHPSSIHQLRCFRWSGASSSAAPSKEATPAKDDDFDLFDSEEEEETEEQKRVKEERLAAYAEKKSKKPGVIAKSSILLDVKPWDDETKLEEIEEMVRAIEMDGLLWGACESSLC